MSDQTPSTRRAVPGEVRIKVGKRRAKLPRTLGVPALFSACYGNVGSSIYYALGVTAAVALGLTPLALILAGGIFVTTALNYAEGTAAMPQAGGSSSFSRRAFNRPVGFIVGWVQLLNYTATVSISGYTAISYLGVFGNYLEPLRMLSDPHWHAGAAVLLVGLLIVLNIVGIEESSAINFTLAILDLITQLVLVILGMALLFNLHTVLSNIHWGVAPTWDHFLASVSLAMVTYTGIETISNLSEEARDPGHAVPRATFAVIAAVLFVSAFLPSIGMSVFPVHMDGHGHYITDLATNWKDDPVAGIVTFFRPAALAFWSQIWVGILAFTILVIATNAGLIGISRLSYSLSAHDLFPKAFSALHPRFKTPYISIAVFGVAGAALILPAQIELMGAVYSLAATFAFATAHLAVMRLRYVAPRIYRPYVMPLNIKFGQSTIPVLSVVGALAIGAVFTQLIASDISRSTFIFLGWLLVGVVAFIAYRVHRGAPLWEPLESPPPALANQPGWQQLRPEEQRVHVGRRSRPHEAGPLHPELHLAERSRWSLDILTEAWGRPRTIGAVAGLILLSLVAVTLDLSPLDPTGPGLGWSVGFVAVALLAAYLLLRSRGEH